MPAKYSEEEFLSKFWEKVDKTSDASGCWLWMGGKRKGYGRLRYNGNLKAAHTVAYLLSGKTIPNGLDLCHSGLCIGKRNCCNPEHLTPGTRSKNCGEDRLRDGTLISKLTATQILEIRNRCTEPQQDLAEEFGVTKGTISKIILRTNWKHL